MFNPITSLLGLKKNYQIQSFTFFIPSPPARATGYREKQFDKLFLSHEVGFIKPEEDIYRAVEKVSGFPSEEHIFIDDIKEYFDASKSIGWDGIQFVGYNDLVKNLKTRKIL